MFTCIRKPTCWCDVGYADGSIADAQETAHQDASTSTLLPVVNEFLTQTRCGGQGCETIATATVARYPTASTQCSMGAQFLLVEYRCHQVLVHLLLRL